MRGAQTEMIDRFEEESRLNGEIGVDSRCARPYGWFRVMPRRDRLFVKPPGETPSTDPRAVVRTPVADAITEDRRGCGHSPIVTVGVT